MEFTANFSFVWTEICMLDDRPCCHLPGTIFGQHSKYGLCNLRIAFHHEQGLKFGTAYHMYVCTQELGFVFEDLTVKKSEFEYYTRHK